MPKSLGDLVKGRKTVIAKPGDTVLAVAKRLKAANVGAAPIVKDGILVGIFTERDLLKRVVAAGKNAVKLPVSKVMTKTPVTAVPTNRVLEGLEVMRQHNCRHLPLIDNGKLVGIVSQRDIITAILDMKEEEIDGLKQLLDLLPIEPGVG
ncbi:MAG: CBS domain-containing protein [Planctomycetes bacterium]|nr:CBS domain-containing protein [Planctomycetota bacterium]